MQQRGFTLIELIIVIVILGILAVTAAPKFLDISDDANAAASAGIQGSVVAAANTVRAAWLVRGSSGTTVAVDGSTITVENDSADAATTANGYPEATAAGIGNSVDISSGWTTMVGAAGFIFVGTDPVPTDDTANGTPCVNYSLGTDDRPVTLVGSFTWVSATASTCS